MSCCGADLRWHEKCVCEPMGGGRRDQGCIRGGLQCLQLWWMFFTFSQSFARGGSHFRRAAHPLGVAPVRLGANFVFALLSLSLCSLSFIFLHVRFIYLSPLADARSEFVIYFLEGEEKVVDPCHAP